MTSYISFILIIILLLLIIKLIINSFEPHPTDTKYVPYIEDLDDEQPENAVVIHVDEYNRYDKIVININKMKSNEIYRCMFSGMECSITKLENGKITVCLYD